MPVDRLASAIPLDALVDPRPHVRQDPAAVLLRLALDQGVVHPLVQDQRLVGARRPLVEHLRSLRRRDPVIGAVHRQEGRGHLDELGPEEIAEAGELPHGAHPGLPRVPPRVGSDDPEAVRILNGLSHHLVVGHRRPGVGHSEEEAVEEEPEAGRFHVVRDNEERGGEDEPRPGARLGAEVHE
ncbi:hypothetical protein GW17_00028544 [Ensete ventricosum]|nr:hypothetical protein GW17_00028544 [Ensete ventricosum]